MSYTVCVRILLVDNYDSFTYNLYQQIGALGADVIIAKNDQINAAAIRSLAPTHIVLSPGPGTPDGAGASNDIIRAFAGVVPLLGVCLGHQCIGQVFSPYGAKNVVHAPELLHGKTSPVSHNEKGILRGVPSPFTAARYHSLLVKEVPPMFREMCWTTAADGKRLIMGLMHESLPVFGVQFHPESFLTPDGNRIIENFLACRA
ncbi:MAG TPA: aminodeoxychorismate/anthranilate synthase component II [Candidatus Peribacteria bacterium]|nr:aminodeoxychorismate/anthranilate synthase component II [Candidatus Peribacteria bacterium]